jgi:hypothetical protein
LLPAVPLVAAPEVAAPAAGLDVWPADGCPSSKLAVDAVPQAHDNIATIETPARARKEGISTLVTRGLPVRRSEPI